MRVMGLGCGTEQDSSHKLKNRSIDETLGMNHNIGHDCDSDRCSSSITLSSSDDITAGRN
jgi:hypothetical protein